MSDTPQGGMLSTVGLQATHAPCGALSLPYFDPALHEIAIVWSRLAGLWPGRMPSGSVAGRHNERNYIEFFDR